MARDLRHLACMLLAACPAHVLAQGAAATYPSKPIRMIVPLAAGGPSDTIARIVAARMTEAIGQNIIVENRPGASGIIGTEVTAVAVAGKPEDYRALILRETAKWKKVVQTAGIQAQ